MNVFKTEREMLEELVETTKNLDNKLDSYILTCVINSTDIRNIKVAGGIIATAVVALIGVFVA